MSSKAPIRMNLQLNNLHFDVCNTMTHGDAPMNIVRFPNSQH